MESRSKTILEETSICFRSRTLALLLSCLILVSLAAPTTSAQSKPSRQLTLIHPDDQNFESLLANNYPGFQHFEAYQTVRSFLVLLRNDTANSARAYAIKWEIRGTDGLTHRLQNYYIQKHFLPVTERRPLVPGEVRLLAPFLNLSPDQYNVQYDYVAKLVASNTSFALFSPSKVSSVNTTVDAAIYDDGAYAGPDHFQLLLRYQCVRDAERDEANSVLQLMDANVPSEEIVQQLHQHTKDNFAVNTSHLDRATLYALYRGKEAQHLLGQHEHGGDTALRRRATAMAQHPRETLTPISQELSK
jgi:hypothetical protein